MYKKILIPLDNSATDQAILDHIGSLVKLTGAQVFLVHVADGFGARLQDELNLADSDEIQKDKEYMDQQCHKLIQKGFQAKAILLQGKEPAEAILEIAEKEHCDLIAMATHGHGFVKDVILGSVADSLRHKTDIPILMIRSSIK
jgi:nucleotide-binding universal stress UspA family protein